MALTVTNRFYGTQNHEIDTLQEINWYLQDSRLILLPFINKRQNVELKDRDLSDRIADDCNICA